MKLPKAPHANCEECPLVNKPVAPSNGPGNAKVALVSRSPGKWDTSAGIPFSGPSGKLLNFLFQKYGVSRDDVFLTNVVLCQTDEPSEEAINCCRPRLDKEIDDLLANGCKMFIAGGAEATEWFIGDKAVKKYRGQIIDLKGTEAQLVVTFNPAAALRTPAVFPDLDADIRRALTPPKPYVKPDIEVISDGEKAKEICNYVGKLASCSADIEATGLTQFDKLVSIGFSGDDSKGYVFTKELVQDPLFLSEVLKPTLEKNAFSWHSGKYDTKVLKAHGIEARVHDDTLLLSYLLDERPGVHNLDYCLQNYLGWPYYTPGEVQWGKENAFDYPPEEMERCMELVYEYNGMDAVGGFALKEYLKARLVEEDNGFR